MIVAFYNGLMPFLVEGSPEGIAAMVARRVQTMLEGNMQTEINVRIVRPAVSVVVDDQGNVDEQRTFKELVIDKQGRAEVRDPDSGEVVGRQG